MAISLRPLESNTWPRWISSDLHVHSIYSGGSLSPGEILRVGGRNFLDAVAISDHNEVRGTLEEAGEVQDNFSLPWMVSSQEVSAGDHFHFLLIGSKKSQRDVNRSAILEVIRKHRDGGGAVIWAHPWTMPNKNWARNCLKELVAENMLDGVELFNASLLEFTGDPGEVLAEIWEEWVIPNQLGVFGGSDYHYLRKGRIIGSGRTYLKVSRPGEAGVIEAIRCRRTVGGIFHSQFLDLGWIGKGHGLFLGMDPWLSEIKTMIAEEKGKVERDYSLQPFLRGFLLNMLDAGHFQIVHDFLQQEKTPITF